MLFDFSLRPLEEVHPWGNSNNLNLSWFGLTEGFYCLQVGSDFLLNYSHKFNSHRAKQFPNDYCGEFIDYYVVRLWEDLLDMLPDVLEPLPPKLLNLLEKNPIFSWRNEAVNWLERQADEDQAFEVFEEAISWEYPRRLHTSYLQNNPRIWMWSTAECVVISWDNSGITWEGIQVWSAAQGNFYMDRDVFLGEVQAFHNNLILQMAERVEIVTDRWHQPEFHVDIDLLRQEQKDRATWFDRALKKVPSRSWDKVLSAIVDNQFP